MQVVPNAVIMKEANCRWIYFIIVLLFAVVSVESLDEDMLLYWRRSNSEVSKCQPFTTYLVSCNKCVCSADGTEYCTRMACFKSNKFISGALRKKTPEVIGNIKHQPISEYDVDVVL